ncbi:MAG: hypothetical protein M1831_005887 [Alyxoria varia]|nr:MAG: hypothetical protein M1831_005887 [Alyxoria varia]
MTPEIIVPATFLILLVFVWFTSRTDKPKIKGLPEIPGVPIFGNLLQLGQRHAEVTREWSKRYGPAFQTRLGNRRIVFATTFDSVKHLWITNQSALISRPTLHTFHSVVSTSQGFTIGTSPWDASCKRRRKAAATALNKPAVQSYMPIIDLESAVSIRELLRESKAGEVDIDPCVYFQRYALNTSLTLNYGFRIGGGGGDGVGDEDLSREITEVEREVSNLRSTSNNWQDYIPLLRLWPRRNREAQRIRQRRDVYMSGLLEELRYRIRNGTDVPCIAGNVLKDPDARGLNEAELKSICLSMVSAGLDTVPGNLIMCIAYLSSAPDGPTMQQRAHDEITRLYPEGDAWQQCLTEEKVPYITALVKETLRFWTVIPISLPRVSIKGVVWNGVTIPAGTTFFMNAHAADFDPTHFTNPWRFDPDRYLARAPSSESGSHTDEGAVSTSGQPHYGYGAGSRMCAGAHLANRELYTALLRLIVAFEFVEARDPRERPVLHPFGCNGNMTSLTTDPRGFRVGLKVRDGVALERWLEGSLPPEVGGDVVRDEKV